MYTAPQKTLPIPGARPFRFNELFIISSNLARNFLDLFHKNCQHSIDTHTGARARYSPYATIFNSGCGSAQIKKIDFSIGFFHFLSLCLSPILFRAVLCEIIMIHNRQLLCKALCLSKHARARTSAKDSRNLRKGDFSCLFTTATLCAFREEHIYRYIRKVRSFSIPYIYVQHVVANDAIADLRGNGARGVKNT